MMRIIIADAVKKGIRNIKTDPCRSIRNLVDLGNHFSTGRFQQAFFENTQTLLRDPQSPYYDLIHNAVTNVDSETLTTLGVNTGYMSWTYGAAKIRNIEQEAGYNIPWTLFLDYRCPFDDPLDFTRIIEEGQPLGIYTYMLFLGSDQAEASATIRRLANYPESSFILFSDDAAVSAVLALEDSALRNVVISIGLNQPDCVNHTRLLAEKKRFFGIHLFYGDADVPAILSGAYIERMAETGAVLANFIAKGNCSREARTEVASYIRNIRIGQAYPIFPVALYSDADYVERIISSGNPCMIHIGKNGAVTTSDGDTPGIDARRVPLRQILAGVMPDRK